MRPFLVLLLGLCACTPSLGDVSAGASTPEAAPPASGQVAVWRAQVSGADEFAGTYEGELASATVQDARVLALELVNRTWRGTARYADDALDSPPLLLVYRAGGPLGGTASAVFKPEGQPQDETFTGPAEADLEVDGGFVVGTLSFRGENPVGLQIELRADVRAALP